jgi:CO dehydrogenase maturation factor
MCGAHAAVRHLLGGMMQASHPITIVDMEAGLEHLSRGTARHVDTLLVILEPYYKALETGRRAAQLGRELGVGRILAVANKIRDEADSTAVREFAATHGIPIAVEVPLDDRIRKADLAGRAPIDVPDSPAVAAIASLAANFAG